MNILDQSILEHMKSNGYFNTRIPEEGDPKITFRCCTTENGKILAHEVVQDGTTSTVSFAEFSPVTGERDGNYTEFSVESHKKATDYVVNNSSPVVVYENGVLTDQPGNGQFASQATLVIGDARRKNRGGNSATIFTSNHISFDDYKKATERLWNKERVIG